MEDSFPTSLIFTMLALVVVLVIAWFAIKMLALLGTNNTKGGRVRVLQSVAVGTRERLVLLDFDNREILIGVTAGGITVLDTGNGLDPSKPLIPAAGNNNTPTA